eukprot:comp20168_c0_seq1/m.24977 comp20168_c0_seq1/g.24977  ORF comp20168_c0_seq1/g.24977 comp20168_c0_seq1/m.24977 type:complete len:558 (-) comp20168_c0_seq1:523-2196(-)
MGSAAEAATAGTQGPAGRAYHCVFKSLAALGLLLTLTALHTTHVPVIFQSPVTLEAPTNELRKAEPVNEHVPHKYEPQNDTIMFFHISDTHVDPYFSPRKSMGSAICHACQFSQKVFGPKSVYCPQEIPILMGGEAKLIHEGYAFGRYGCNPPPRLLESLVAHIKSVNPDPKFIIFTGDIAPHGYPGDNEKVTAKTKLSDLCQTKLLIMRQQIRYLRTEFPNTKWVFTMGNNDHFPKNTYWQPFITALGDMFLEEGFITKDQHKDFVTYGSTYHDIDGARFLCLDLTLFSPGGEMSFKENEEEENRGKNRSHVDPPHLPVRDRTIEWVEKVLADAKAKNYEVILIGHQPLTTKKGKDELDTEGLHYGKLKTLLSQYSKIIPAGFFGHRNLAGINTILGPLGTPLIPSVTAPGVSPRGLNNPCFNVIYMNPESHIIEEFEQWIFELMDENELAKEFRKNGTHHHYLGRWRQHKNDVYSWRAVSGGQNFTVDSVINVLNQISTDSKMFFAMEVWKRAGYIGDETPENYQCKAVHDSGDAMMRCLFPDQDVRCWDKRWLK